jgi:hypothetical protein
MFLLALGREILLLLEMNAIKAVIDQNGDD